MPDEIYVVDSESGCWIWKGYIQKNGYAKIGSKYAHRVFYENKNGKIPVGLVLDHLCRVHSCVNPDHLEAVTQKENVMRGVGITKINKQKTHCARGHLLEGENIKIVVRPDGTRRKCKVCDREMKNEKYWRNKNDK